MKLRRYDVVMIVIGAIIGWGAFSLPGTSFLPSAGVIDTAIGLAIGGIAVIFIQQGYHVMFEHHIDEGGEASFAARVLGQGHGFAVGWSLVLAYTSIVAFNGLAFVFVLKRIVGDGISQVAMYSVAGHPVYLTDVLLTSAVMVAVFWTIIKGLRTSANTENILVTLLVVSVVVLVVAMFFVVGTESLHTDYVAGWRPNVAHIGAVVAIVPFLFVGFDVIPQLSAELNFHPREVFRLAVLGISAGVAIYALMNVITGMVYGPDEASSLEWATGSAIHDHLGLGGFAVLGVAVVGAVLGGINGFAIASTRLLAYLARERVLPTTLRHRNAAGVYDRAVYLCLAISLVAPWAGREALTYIVDMSSLLAAVAYLYTCWCAIKVADAVWKKAMSGIGLLFAVGFVALLVIPGSPGELSTPTKWALAVWAMFGVGYYLRANARAKRAGDAVRVGPQDASANLDDPVTLTSNAVEYEQSHSGRRR